MRRLLPLFAMIVALTDCGESARDEAVSLSVIRDKGSVIESATAQGLVAFDSDGQIEPALAERWIVSDDGLSLVFRLGRKTWSNGKSVQADDVAQSLKQSFAKAGDGRLGHLFSAFDSVVAMTDRVIEIRLKQPRPNMLQLLAQPEFGIRHNGFGTGPYRVYNNMNSATVLRPSKTVDDMDVALTEEQMAAQEVHLRGESAAMGISRYLQGQTQAVLGGTFEDYPLVQAQRLRPSQIVIDPVRGLFGLAFVGRNPITSDVIIRQALNMAIDREALARTLNLPNWSMRETILPARLDSGAEPAVPDWSGSAIDARRAEAARRISNWSSHHKDRAVVKVALPTGAGARLLFARIAADWRSIGVQAISVGMRDAADLRLIDEVAPSASVNWYFTRLSCDAGLPCDQISDQALLAERAADTLDARSGDYAQADSAYAANATFIPLGNPFRWSLTSVRLPGLRPSVYGVHPLAYLRAARN